MLATNFVNSVTYYFLFNGRIQLWEYTVLPVYLFIIYLLAKRRQRQELEKNPEYKYYVTGLFAKILGVIGFCGIYTYYYDGGDTFVYFNNASSLVNIAFTEPSSFFSIIFGSKSAENYVLFLKYGANPQYWNDAQSFFVSRFMIPFAFLGMKAYLLTSIVVAYITYSGVWRLYQLFVEHFPDMKKELAIAVLFMPSVCFWGSGILKDSITLAASGWLVYGFYYLFIKTPRKRKVYLMLVVFVSSFFIIAIKPYIFYSLVFGLLIWVTFLKIKSIKSNFHRILLFPSIFILSWFIGAFIISQTGSITGGSYENVDKMITKADVTRKDLLREAAYGANNFDIGYYDKNSYTSILKKVPAAIVAGLYRPYLWETKNIVMLLSGLENLIVMFFTLFIIFRKGPLFLINTLFDNPLILFSFVFAIVFAFSIGFSTSNFGALVRYKIPLIPFFMAALFFVRRKQINVEIEDETKRQLYVPKSPLKV